MARTCSIDRRPGLLGRIVSAQAAHPRGPLGRALGRLWLTETAEANDRAITLLDIAPGDRVLEIGFGPAGPCTDSPRPAPTSPASTPPR